MIFIDKSLKAAEGRHINVQFLKDIFDANSLTFSMHLDKNAYKKYVTEDAYKNIWRPLLCDEQNNVCCYCMRRISIVTADGKSGFTAEHVVPQSLKGSAGKIEFQKYISGTIYAQNIADGVEYSEDVEAMAFTSVDDIDEIPKMPHVISHQNLLAACKGIRGTIENGCCCNNDRQNAYIVPYMLIPNGYARFKYDPNGIVSMKPSDDSWTIILESLNSDTLQEIRHIWYLIAKNTKFLTRHFTHDATELLKMNILKTAFKVNNFLYIPEKYRKYAGKIMGKGNDFTWNLLVDYSWFLSYYKSTLK